MSATPEISVHWKTDAKYLILGSDGFWEEATQTSMRKIVRS
jgi:serine/threonine protein phosphatase PrpC